MCVCVLVCAVDIVVCGRRRCVFVWVCVFVGGIETGGEGVIR